MQSTSQDSYNQTNGSGSGPMRQSRTRTRSRSRSRSSSKPSTNDNQSQSTNVDGMASANGMDRSDSHGQAQEDPQDQQPFDDSFQEDVEMNHPSRSSKRRSRPSTNPGGNKRKKSKGKGKANSNPNLNLNQSSDQSLLNGQDGQGGEGGKKPTLASLERPLLALDVPKARDMEVAEEEEEKEELKLWLKQDDRSKLQVVISSIDPDLLNEPLPNLDSSNEDESMEKSETLTLEKALQTSDGEKGVELKELVLRIHALRQPLLTSSSLADVEDEEEEDDSIERQDQPVKNGPQTPLKDSKALDQERIRLSNLTLISSLLEDLATQYRKEESLANSSPFKNRLFESDEQDGIEDEDHEMAVLLGLEEPKRKKQKKDQRLRKFALHMRLPDGDYFTNAAEMTDEMIEELDTGNADLIEILPESQTVTSQQVPSLGSRLPLHSSLLPPRSTSAQIKERKNNVLVPTKGTTFGDFSSFLPSYDTRNSSMSFGASEVVWNYKSDERRLRSLERWNDPEGIKALEWKSRNSVQELSEEPPMAPVASASSTSASTPSLEELLSQPLPGGIDAELLRSSAAQLELQEQVGKELVKNSELVKQLQSYQWDRLRREYSRTRDQELKIRDRLSQLPKDKNGKIREKEALDLVKKIRKENHHLTIKPGEEEQAIARDLFSSLNKLVGSHDVSCGERLIPTVSQLRSLAASSAFSNPSGPNIPKGFWGTLPAAPSEDPSSSHPSLVVDNSTFRLTNECAELATSEAEKKGDVLGTTQDKKVGLLDRIAESRKYDEKDDQHNIEISRPVQHQQPGRPQAAAKQQQNQLNPNAFSKLNFPSSVGGGSPGRILQNQSSSTYRNTSPNKSFSPMPFQQPGLQPQRYPPTPINSASRIGSNNPQLNHGVRPSYPINPSINGAQQGVGLVPSPRTPNQQINGHNRPKNPAPIYNSMGTPNPNQMNARPPYNQIGQFSTPQQQQQQLQTSLNQPNNSQRNGYQQPRPQMSPPTNASPQR